ncbi:hypothetical protein [Calidifontibacillus oryziterrae]|uniref:hypothetical protein n=1 Tax=Calidifontibacillus oryziterrae TaxID=1191699 RepID=UPI0002DA5DA9|nr:hypothetical protein [Calidifontibacillus oryziterrae]
MKLQLPKKGYLLNNKGAALVTALLIITLLFIFSSVLIFTIFNNVQQTQITEAQIQATNMSEMAVMYFEEYVAAQVKTSENNVEAFFNSNPETTGDELTQLFCNQFYLSPIHNIPVSVNKDYKAMITSVSIDRSDCNKIYVEFTSAGVYKGKTENINGSFFINNHSIFPERTNTNVMFPDIPTYYSSKCNSLENCDGLSSAKLSGTIVAAKKDTNTINGLYIEGALNMSKNHSNLIIKSGDLFVNGPTSIGNQSIIQVQNGNGYFRTITGATNAEIHISGDAYIYGDITNFKASSGNQLLLKVSGTVYVPDNSDLPTNYHNYCSADKSRGICASNYSVLSQSPLNVGAGEDEIILKWAIDRPSISIEYE